MRNVCGAVLAASLVVNGAVAQPLAPGKPAGVKQARLSAGYELELLAAGALIMTGVGLAVSGSAIPGTVNSQSIPSQQVVVPPVSTISTSSTG